MTLEPLTKVEVAKHQLTSAIRLFFEDADPISIYSLAANAWEIIDTLCARFSVLSVSNQTREHIPIGKDLKFNYVNSPYRNYFKHAERDIDAVLHGFKDELNDHLLFLAVEDYIRLNKRSPLEFQVFQFWYIAMYSEKLADDVRPELFTAIYNQFSNIKDDPRYKQKEKAKLLLKNAKFDSELVSHPKTEATFYKY